MLVELGLIWSLVVDCLNLRRVVSSCHRVRGKTLAGQVNHVAHPLGNVVLLHCHIVLRPQPTIELTILLPQFLLLAGQKKGFCFLLLSFFGLFNPIHVLLHSLYFCQGGFLNGCWILSALPRELQIGLECYSFEFFLRAFSLLLLQPSLFLSQPSNSPLIYSQHFLNVLLVFNALARHLQRRRRWVFHMFSHCCIRSNFVFGYLWHGSGHVWLRHRRILIRTNVNAVAIALAAMNYHGFLVISRPSALTVDLINSVCIKRWVRPLCFG